MSGCHGCGADLAPNIRPGRARKWCSERCRKQTLYSSPCVDCGKPLDGSAGSGSSRQPQRCVPCNSTHRTIWSRERVIEAIQLWERLHGDIPSAPEWLRAGPLHPCTRQVQDRFGSWNAAMTAAGFTPRQVGVRRAAGKMVRER